MNNDIFSKIKNGDLYALLANCNQEELDPLVKSITKRFNESLKNIADKFSNSIELNTTYKRYYPDHTKYTDLIADEIRLYGGNSISNMYRQRTGPEYKEILFDVCQKLDIPSKKEDIRENEKNLLALCLPDNWKNFDSIEQQKVVKKAGEKYKTYSGIITSGTGTATLATEGLLATAIRVVSLPVGVGLVAKGVTDPAFTVTIPCIFQIAYLRWKILKAIEENSFSTTSNSYTKSNSELIIKRNLPLILGENSENPVLTFALAEISEKTSINWQTISESDDTTGISRFNPLLQAVPNLVTKAHVTTTQYVQSNISLESLTRVKDSLNEFRGFVQGENGRITEHVKLISPDKLQNIVNAAALFQVASVIVAQKHLADINQKLTEIKKIVDDIHTHQRDKRETDMTGAIDYFKLIAPSILAGELRDSYQHQIEKYEGDLLSIRNHLIKDIEKLNFEIKGLKNSDTFGSEGMKKEIEIHQNKILDTYEQLLMCIKARACGWQLLLAFPNTEEISKTRKNDIHESIKILDINGKLLDTTITEIGKKIRGLNAITNTNQTINSRKLDLLKWQDKLIDKITTTTYEIKTNIDSIFSLIENKNENVSFLLKIENEKIVARAPL
jgi:uncharacterized protein YaaW (UPF0174 family)